MTDQLCGIEIAKAFDHPITTIFVCAAKLMPEGPATILLLVVLVCCTAAVPFVFRYYAGLVGQGAAPEGSIERQDYDKLRASLTGDNLAARLYAKWLTAFLDGVERFFGDAGMADRTLFPRAFGLKTPAPLWTAPAFDRCLLLALVYPIATIFAIWAISGHVGPAETALTLTPNVPSLSRALDAVAIGFSSFAFWRAVLSPGWKCLLWIALFLVAGAGYVPLASAGWGAAIAAPAGAGVVAVAFTGAGAGAVTGALAVGFALAFALVAVVAAVAVVVFALVFDLLSGFETFFAFAVQVAVTYGFFVAFGVAFPVTVASVFAAASAGAGAGAVAGAVTFAAVLAVVGLSPFFFAGAGAGALVFAAGVWLLHKRTTTHRGQGVFQSLFLPAMILACFAAAAFLSPLADWVDAGPLLLFLGLLTLLNAPFDWASLGLTRALLRRGLELGGWWPYLLALVDATLAVGIIALLALVMVIGVQAFDELAVHGGGKPVLPLDTLFDGIAKNPAAPEYWWAYALLLSSMIPSLINLAIGGMAFTRGIPWLARLILNWIPEGKAVPEYKRQLVTIGLTLQMFAGAGLGIAAQAFLAWGLIFHVMPWIGLDLLDMARAVAAFDLPRQLWQIFARIL
jgi:hypothetical protein